jgi:hypothetical protein
MVPVLLGKVNILDISGHAVPEKVRRLQPHRLKPSKVRAEGHALTGSQHF